MMEWKPMAETICRSLIPGVPCYLVHWGGRPGLWRGRARAYGGSDCDLQLYSLLIEQGGWRGRGFAAVFLEDRPADDPPLAREFDGVCIALHELGHYCETPPNLRPVEELPPGTIERLMEHSPEWHHAGVYLRAALAHVDAGGTLESFPGMPPWYLHGARFWRMVHHVSARAEWRGGHIYARWIADSANYGLSDTEAYAAVMADEVDRLSETSLMDISATAPPAELIELFERDTKTGSLP